MVLTAQLPVLLIRGLTREQRHWGAFRPLLAQSLEQSVLCFDFAGCGALYKATSPASIAGLMQSVRRQWLEQQEYKQPVHLVALSLGGMLALQWAVDFPDEVASITLINSSARPLSPFYQRLRWQRFGTVLRLAFASQTEREQQILRLSSAEPWQHNDTLQQWICWQQQRPVSAGNALRQLLAASRFALQRKPACPVQVLSSARDYLVNPACSEALANFLAAQHYQHEWAGHDVALDDPAWLVQQVVAFIRG